MKKDLSILRENYNLQELNEESCPDNPIQLFEQWMKEAVEKISVDANAMNISTVGKNMRPATRTVLLKELHDDGFIFYTHYNSQKGLEIAENPNVCLHFWWKELERQVRIQGIAKPITREQSEAYFNSRPKGSQIGAIASPQSQKVTKQTLVENFQNAEEKYKHLESIQMPETWGGYIVTADLIEFWQGRPNRMHDRIEYELTDGEWTKHRLAP